MSSLLDQGQIIRNVHDPVNEALQVNVVATTGGTSPTEKTDDSAFTPGTDIVAMVGAEYNDVAPDSVDEGDAGALRMSANRNLYTQIRDAAGNERGANVNASNELKVNASQSGNWSARLQDGSGNALTSTGNALDVNIKSESIVVEVALDNANDSVLTYGYDGATNRAIKTDASGELQVDVLTQPARSASTDSIQIGDGTDLALVTAAGELNVLESNSGAIAASLSVLDDWDESDRAKINPIVGQAGVQGGSGTVSANTQRVVLATDVSLPAGTNAIGKLAANDGVDIGDVTINNAAGASAVNIQDGGNSITVDGTVAATQSGNWSVRAQDGSGNALTSSTVGSNQGLHVRDLGYTNVEFVRNDYSSVNVTTAAYTQLIASTSNEYQELHIWDSSGQTLKLATGGAGVEVDKIIIPPGGCYPIKFRIASGTRIAIRAVSATASVGEINIQFLG